MNRTRASRRMREKRLNRALMLVFALVLFIGVFTQIALMARLSGQSKQIAATGEEINALQSSTENLDRAINQYHDKDRIARRAEQLGMVYPTDTQLRVVNLPTLIDNTSTQSADSTGAEEMID